MPRGRYDPEDPSAAARAPRSGVGSACGSVLGSPPARTSAAASRPCPQPPRAKWRWLLRIGRTLGRGTIFLRSATRAGLFASTATLLLATQPIAARAATVEWQIGPVGIAAGQAAQVGYHDLDIFPCSVGVRGFAGPASRVVAGVTTAAAALVVDTYQSPSQVPAGGVQVVGYGDPNLATTMVALPATPRLPPAPRAAAVPQDG